jgi:predicted RNA-binding Zn-ribbon protein involved in translation (DUF1610 family)
MSTLAPTTSTATLLIDSGGDKLEPRAIGVDTTIGRDRRCTVTIDHPTVSRTHARIYRDAAGWHFVDLGSQNGSKLGDERARDASALHDGAELRIGRVRAWFFAEAVPPGWSPPDAPRLAGKLIRCTCGHIGWAPIAAGDGQLRCTACGRDITRRDPNPPTRGSPPSAKAVATADCAACHTSIAAGEAMHTCPDCAATMHVGCWEENRGCATYGCPQVGVLDAQTVDAASDEFDEPESTPAGTARDMAMSETLRQSLMAVAAFAAAGLPLFGVPPIGYGAWLLVANDVHGEGRRRYLWAAVSFAAGVFGFAYSARWWLGIRM